MRRVAVCLFVLCFALVSTTSFASRDRKTYYLKILVEDARTGKPVAHARVENQNVLHDAGSRVSESTDSRGQVCVSRTFNLGPNGSGHQLTYGTTGFSTTVTISRAGYETTTEKVAFGLANTSRLQIVRLRPTSQKRAHSGGGSSYPSSEPTWLPSVPPRGYETSAPRKFQESAVTGKLVISSNPQGASVWIDGEGTSSDTPLMVDIQAGEHKVKVRYQGATLTKSINVPMEKKVRLSFDLRSELAKLKREKVKKAREFKAQRKALAKKFVTYWREFNSADADISRNKNSIKPLLTSYNGMTVKQVKKTVPGRSFREMPEREAYTKNKGSWWYLYTIPFDIVFIPVSLLVEGDVFCVTKAVTRQEFNKEAYLKAKREASEYNRTLQAKLDEINKPILANNKEVERHIGPANRRTKQQNAQTLATIERLEDRKQKLEGSMKEILSSLKNLSSGHGERWPSFGSLEEYSRHCQKLTRG